MAAIQNPLMGDATKNAKVVAIALGSLQLLIALRAVSLSAIPATIQTMNDCMSQGVDIQPRFSSPPSPPFTTNYLQALFKLHGSRPATLCQLVMFIVDKVVEEDRRMLVFQSRQHKQSVPPRKTFALELTKNVLTNYHQLFCKASSITLMFTEFRALLLLQHHLFALLLKALSERSTFPLAPRGTRVVLLLLKQFSSELEAEAEVILTYSSNSHQAHWRD
ncbi:hypothetical protein BGY98DRAFT_1191486 [Russula aff. rugulosa BPL654]|nr:hypothetical protein BGY98DRAFT_1191486 [Russula aff. rugulosa BPL654]